MKFKTTKFNSGGLIELFMKIFTHENNPLYGMVMQEYLQTNIVKSVFECTQIFLLQTLCKGLILMRNKNLIESQRWVLGRREGEGNEGRKGGREGGREVRREGEREGEGRTTRGGGVRMKQRGRGEREGIQRGREGEGREKKRKVR